MTLPAQVHATTVTKILYVYDNQTLTRTPQTADTSTPVTLVGGNVAGSSADWSMSPAVATGETLTLAAQTVTVNLVLAATNNQTSFSRTVSVELRTDTGTITSGTPPTVTVANGNTLYAVSVPITATSIAATHFLVLRITNDAPQGPRNVTVSQRVTGTGSSTVSFTTSTFINVDSVTVYNAAYSAITTQSAYVPNSKVYIRAVLSDPFGSYDIDPATGGTAPSLTLTDPNSTVQLNAVAMTQVADSGVATKTFEYYVVNTTGYTLANNAVSGIWTASVTAHEGTEGTVTAAGNGTFTVATPSLLIMKTVSANSDPVEGSTKAKAIPGATLQYTVLVQNNGAGPVDNNTIVIADPIPANTKFVLGSVAFTDGTASSGLTLPAANVTYSNNGGGSYVYTPVNDGTGADPNVTDIMMALSGSMNGKTGGTAPSFTITFLVVIK